MTVYSKMTAADVRAIKPHYTLEEVMTGIVDTARRGNTCRTGYADARLTGDLIGELRRKGFHVEREDDREGYWFIDWSE